MEGGGKHDAASLPVLDQNTRQRIVGAAPSQYQEQGQSIMVQMLGNISLNHGNTGQETELRHHSGNAFGIVPNQHVAGGNQAGMNAGRMSAAAAPAGMHLINTSVDTRRELIDSTFPMGTFPDNVTNNNAAAGRSFNMINNSQVPQGMYSQQTQQNQDASSTASTLTTNCLHLVLEQLNKISKFSESRQQLMSNGSLLQGTNPADLVHIFHQSFQAIINQVNQTQQSVRNMLNTIQEQEMQQPQQQQMQQDQHQEMAGGPVPFPHPPQEQHRSHRQRENQVAFLTENLQESQRTTRQMAHNIPAANGTEALTNINELYGNNSGSNIRPSLASNGGTITSPPTQSPAKPRKLKALGTASTSSGYKRRKERPLPPVPPPDNNAKQYTKQQAMEILVNSGAGENPKDRNRLIGDWIARNLVPVTAHTTMNKYVRQFRDSGGVIDQEWERVDDFDEHGISKRIHIPEPTNQREYTRREAIQILMQISQDQNASTRDRNSIISSWIAQGKIPVKSLSAVERNVQQAEKDGIDSIQEHWGRWGDTQHEKREKKAKALAERRERMTALSANLSSGGNSDTGVQNNGKKRKKKTAPTPPTVDLPPYPPPLYGNEYTKLEAVSILQKIPDTQDRNNVIWRWIHEKQIPITHPNSMSRILRDAKNGTLKNMDWRESSSNATLPWTPDPRFGSMFSKSEMIDILSKMNPSDRNKLVRLWVHEKKVPYTSAQSANNAVIKAIREQQEAEALAHGEEAPKRINAAIAATGPPRKKQKRSSSRMNDANTDSAAAAENPKNTLV